MTETQSENQTTTVPLHTNPEGDGAHREAGERTPLDYLAAGAALFSIAVGVLVLAGWWLGIESLKRVLPGLVSMKANGAAGFVLCGAGLWLARIGERRATVRAAGMLCAAIAAAIGLLTLAEYAFDVHLGIDELLVEDTPQLGLTSHPGRMAPNAALCFVLVGVGLFLLNWGLRQGERAAQILALVTGATGLAGMIGYAYSAVTFYRLASYTGMALHTALTLFVVSVGMMSVRPERGILALLIGSNLGALLARRLLPAVIGIPVLLGWLTREGEQAGWYDARFGSALTALGNSLCLMTIALASAHVISRLDLQNKSNQEALARYAGDLQRSNAELQQFAYVASHDLQEPLRMVASFTQLLGKRYAGRLDKDADEFIQYAVDGATRMQNLINDLLIYSRAGTQAKPLGPTDAEQVLRRVMDNLALTAEESGARITRTPLPAVISEEVQLGQLFQNLLTNAMKFRGPQPPRIHVAAERNGRTWKFSVADNGVGIAPEHSERIFLIFQRLHTKAEYPGTGIGLAVCKKIVERHGGRIWLESQPAGARPSSSPFPEFRLVWTRPTDRRGHGC